MPWEAVSNISLHVPTGSRLRPDAPLTQLKLAVARALIAQMTEPGDWHELALVVDAERKILGHPRLIRGLSWGNDDYTQAVHQVVPAVLGLRREPDDEWATSWEVHLDHLVDIEEHLDLPGWLAEHDQRLHRLLYGVDVAEVAALDAVADAIEDLELPDIVRQLDRLRRDLTDDLPAAIGHAKDLVESACKTIIGQTGSGAGSDLLRVPPPRWRTVLPPTVIVVDRKALTLSAVADGPAGSVHGVAPCGFRNGY